MPRAGRWLTALWPALLSLVFPGLGQAFAGAVRRGLVFAAAAAFWTLLYHGSPWLAAFEPGVAPFVLVLLTLGVGLAFVAAIDAFRLARHGRGARLRPLPRWLVYALFAAVPAVPGLAAPIDWAQYRIPSASMVPTIDIGDRLLAIEGYYRYFAPRRGDLVAFEAHGVLYMKRLVGLPGDRVEMRDGALVLNGAPVPIEPLQSYRAAEPACSPGLYPRYRERFPGGGEHAIILDCGPGNLRTTAPVEVPPGHYFMLGDNRDDSEDSRDPVGGFGLVPQEDLVARAIFITFSVDVGGHALGLPFAVRWARTALALD